MKIKGHLIIFIVTTFIPLIATEITFADIPVTERNALVSIYNSTNGDDWLNNTGWNGNPGTENSWFGVTCVNDHVTEINLHQNNLSGFIPSDISNLQSLRLLDIGYNELIGSIPNELGQLTALEYLDLDYNHIRGEIPDELANLTNLTYFWLCQNQLKDEFPIWVANFTNLESLSLAGNMLTGSIPNEIGSLTQLRYLSLWGNLFDGVIPSEIGNLTNLEEVYMAYCNLKGSIPVTLGNLTNLKKIVLMNNNLSGPIPSQIKNLTNLLDNQSDFRWNSLCTNDSELRDFLNTKQRDGGEWVSTQNQSSLPIGDINCDSKIDLSEAVHAIQTTAGIR